MDRLPRGLLGKSVRILGTPNERFYRNYTDHRNMYYLYSNVAKSRHDATPQIAVCSSVMISIVAANRLCGSPIVHHMMRNRRPAEDGVLGERRGVQSEVSGFPQQISQLAVVLSLPILSHIITSTKYHIFKHYGMAFIAFRTVKDVFDIL